MVLTRLMQLLSHEAWPATPVSLRCRDRDRRDCDAVLAGLEPCSLGVPVMAEYEAMVEIVACFDKAGVIATSSCLLFL